MSDPFADIDFADHYDDTWLEGVVDDYLSPGVEPPYDDRLLLLYHAEQRYGSVNPEHVTEYLEQGAPDLNHVASLVAVLMEKMRPLDDEYDRIDSLRFSAIVSLEVYREILGISSPVHLQSHLRRQEAAGFPLHEFFGLDSIPHPNTLRKAEKQRFNRHTNEFISRWGRRLTRIATNRGFYIPEIEEDWLSNNGGVIDVPIEAKRGYAQGALDVGREKMPIEKDGNPIWTDYGVHFDFSLHLCATGGSAEAELENFADNRGLQKGRDIFSDAETFRNDIYRPDIWDWVKTINEWTDDLLDAVYPEELRSRGVPVAIDSTNIPTWSSETSDVAGVLGTKKMANTHYAYRIFTAQALSDGMPFQIAHALQQTSKNRKRRLMGLLDEVENRGFEIGLLLADSEFAPGEVVNSLKNRGVNFVIQVPNKWVSKYTDRFEERDKAFGVVDEYTMNEGKGEPKETTNTLFCSYENLWSEDPKTLGETKDDDDEEESSGGQPTLSQLADVIPESGYASGQQDADTGREIRKVIAEEREEQVDFDQKSAGWLTYITDIDASEPEARTLRDYYRYRWSIESSYSDFKETFLPKTKSTDLALRTYLYLYGLFAYNAWVAANARCRQQHLEGSDRHRPPIRARRFATIGQQRYRTNEFQRDYINFRE